MNPEKRKQICFRILSYLCDENRDGVMWIDNAKDGIKAAAWRWFNEKSGVHPWGSRASDFAL